MPEMMKERLKEYVSALQKIYGTHLQSVILYGSYARGDFEENSDVDIMILVDIPDSEISNFRHQLSDVTFEYQFERGIEIMPIVKNIEHFNKWLRSYPFYNNVKREGVEIYAA